MLVDRTRIHVLAADLTWLNTVAAPPTSTDPVRLPDGTIVGHAVSSSSRGATTLFRLHADSAWRVSWFGDHDADTPLDGTVIDLNSVLGLIHALPEGGLAFTFHDRELVDEGGPMPAIVSRVWVGITSPDLERACVDTEVPFRSMRRPSKPSAVIRSSFSIAG